jgi:prepilin-type N-terminal cleavage/methylation domain-containing protein
MRDIKLEHDLRQGFTMVEILVSLSILAILSAVIVPQMLGKMKDSRTAALSQTLLGLSQAIGEHKKATTKYPGQLTFLTTAPLATSPETCGGGIGAIANLWRGPYVSRQILASGVGAGDAIIQTGIRREVSGTSTFLLIDATGVETSIADDLESQLDGGTADPTGGTIRYTTAAIPAQVGPANPTAAIPAAPTGTVNLSYSIPVRGC